MTTTPDFDLLAVEYLDDQDAGPRLRDIVRMVSAIRTNNPDPGQRRARKADLAAASAAATRLSQALGRIDIGSQAEAMASGIAKLDDHNGAAGPESVRLAPTRLEQLHGLSTLKGLLRTAEIGFGALAVGEKVLEKGGRPQRHDALQMGLEALGGLWRRHRSDAPTQSEKARGFCAFAIDVFASPPVGFTAGTVRNAVAAFLPKTDPAD